VIRNREAIAIETDSSVGHIPHATKRKLELGRLDQIRKRIVV
jgi:hypothetical protein